MQTIFLWLHKARGNVMIALSLVDSTCSLLAVRRQVIIPRTSVQSSYRDIKCYITPVERQRLNFALSPLCGSKTRCIPISVLQWSYRSRTLGVTVVEL